MAGDFLHIVQSRIGMLDVFVTLFVVAAILFAVHDRDRPRAQDWDRRPAGILSALTLHRPWRLLAGLALGAAVAVKWSGAYVALAVIGLTAAWEIAARRSAVPDGRSRSWRSATWLAIREELPRSIVLLGVVPLAVYLAAYIGRMPGELIGLPWQDGTVWRGHLGPPAGDAHLPYHPRGQPPVRVAALVLAVAQTPGRLLLRRQDGYREILAIGNPLTWAAGVIGLVVLAVLWARGGWRVGGPAAVVIVAAISTYLPWLALQGDRSQVFLWYILPTIPFLYAGLGVLAALAWRSVAGRVGRRGVCGRQRGAAGLLPPAADRPAALAGRLARPHVAHRLRAPRRPDPGAARLGDQLRPAAGWLVLDLTDILSRSDTRPAHPRSCLGSDRRRLRASS